MRLAKWTSAPNRISGSEIWNCLKPELVEGKFFKFREAFRCSVKFFCSARPFSFFFAAMGKKELNSKYFMF